MLGGVEVARLALAVLPVLMSAARQDNNCCLRSPQSTAKSWESRKQYFTISAATTNLAIEARSAIFEHGLEDQTKHTRAWQTQKMTLIGDEELRL